MISPNTRAEVEALMRQHAQGAEIIHYIVTWDIGAVVLPRERVAELLVESGVENVATPEIRTSSALIRALKEMIEDRRIEEVYNDADETSYGLIRTIKGDRVSREARHIQEVTVTLRKNAKGTPDDPKVEYSSDFARAQIEPWLERYQRSYTSRDLASRILLHVVRRVGGIKMRRQGGMYFVPATGEADVSALSRFVALVARETGEPCHLSALHIGGDEKSREDMRYHSHSALLDELAEQRTALKDMLRANRAGKVKPATVAGYLNDVDDIGRRASLYRDLMALELRDLNKAMDELRAAYVSVQNGLTVDQFDATLRRVDEALDEAREAGPQVAAEDPFALPFVTPNRDEAIAKAVAKANDGGVTGDDGAPF